MFKLLVLPALLAVISANPLKENVAGELNGRIVGGEDTVIEEVPYQISLQFYEEHICGGSIISENWVVTAGHCVDYSLRYYTIRAGSTYHDHGGSSHKVAEIIRHKGYGADNHGHPVNDIALIRVAKPFVLDETRQPIPLYNAHEESVAGALTTITGWGNTFHGYPSVLQTVQVPIVSKESCYKQYGISGGIPDGEICAAYPEGGKDACQGDSGGPLAIDGRLAGIVSWGRGCAQPSYPGVYTEIASYREWITEHSGELIASFPSEKISDRIIGSRNATIEEVPHQISLEYYGSHICGGSIISNQWVVSAGHCVIGSATRFSVHAGSTLLGSGGTLHNVTQIIRHSAYGVDENGHPFSDISLIRVTPAFVFNKTRQAARLFDPGEPSPVNATSTISGWGVTATGSTRILQLVNVPIISKSQCYNNYKDYGGIPDREICAAYANGGKDPYQGDSGGLLTIGGRLAGIVSWGHGCAVAGNPGVYTEYAVHRYWIRSFTRI